MGLLGLRHNMSPAKGLCHKREFPCDHAGKATRRRPEGCRGAEAQTCGGAHGTGICPRRLWALTRFSLYQSSPPYVLIAGNLPVLAKRKSVCEAGTVAGVPECLSMCVAV